MQRARFEIVESSSQKLVIRDLGPWDQHPTVTNDAEGVVERLVAVFGRLGGRQLFYFDSLGDLDEIVIRDGKFAGFRPGPHRRSP